MNSGKFALTFAAALVACQAQVPNRLPDHVRLIQGQGPIAPSNPTSEEKLQRRAIDASARCAHIRVHVPPSGMDPKIAIRTPAPPSGQEKMPVLKAMPVCPEDVSVLPATKGKPEPKTRPETAP